MCVQITLYHHYVSLVTHVSYIYCKLFTLWVWKTIMRILPFFLSFFFLQLSLQMCVLLFIYIYIYIMCRFNTFTWYQRWQTAKQKLHQKKFAGTKYWRQRKDGFPKRIPSYTLQLLCMEGENSHTSSNQKFLQVNLEYR